MTGPLLVTVAEAAEALGVSTSLIYKWRRAGRIHPAAHVPPRRKMLRGGRVLYDLAELRRVRDTGRDTPDPEAIA